MSTFPLGCDAPVAHVRMAPGAVFRYVEPMRMFDRITQKPGVMGGKACIRGMRVTAAMLVNQIGAGRRIEDVLRDYPDIEREDILQALQYAAWLAEGRDLTLAESA